MQIRLSRLFPFMNWWPLATRQRLRAMGCELYFCKNIKTVMEFLSKAHFIKGIGADNFFVEKQGTIAAIFAKLDQDKCAHCKAHIFYECNLAQLTQSDARTQTTGMPA